jgi:hypothetical protein
LGNGEVNINSVQEERCQFGLRVGPLSRGDSAAAIVITTAGIANEKLGGIPVGWFVAVMRSFTDAAGMRRRDSYRQRERNNVSREREEQQQSGGQAMHGFRESGTSKFGRA